ncbi:META domain-containing protein [Salipiger mangrovisoli]|uniref:META domain-containing protein n=1 Tax=Salipiger mangrovisoli TaxID=2865933 RepID=A0ABR9X5I4_9RHOB|nr:META domain-containing protein [Salipiger mangrovisoli]MBE9638863.1 META domain-containing protein [Salipiger mangrovisoli]
MVVRWIFAGIVAICGPAMAEDAADLFPVHVAVDCAGDALALTLQGEVATLYYSGAEMPMARARAASGVKFDSVDDPETYVWTKGDDAQVRLAGQDLASCRVEQVSRVTEGVWRLASLDGAPVGDTAAELSFEADGQLSGRAGCGVLGGSWSAAGAGSLTVEAEIARGEACSPEEAAQDETLLAALRALTGLGFSPEGDLQLRAGDATRLTVTR